MTANTLTYNDVRKALFGLPRAQRLQLISDAISHIDDSPSIDDPDEPYSVSLDALSKMTEEEQNKAVRRLTNPTPEAKRRSLERLKATIREYEIRYEMSSEQLLTGLRDGTIRETADISKWLFKLQGLQYHENKAQPEPV